MPIISSWLWPGVPPSPGCNQELMAAARSATFSWLQPGAHGCGQECHLFLAATLCLHSSLPCCSRAVASWMRGRLFRCVLATDHKGDVLGCVTVSPLRAEAALPPPFPSSAPLRCYVSNMAVATGARRQGVARRLLAQCERIGERRPLP